MAPGSFANRKSGAAPTHHFRRRARPPLRDLGVVVALTWLCGRFVPTTIPRSTEGPTAALGTVCSQAVADMQSASHAAIHSQLHTPVLASLFSASRQVAFLS